MQFYRLISVRVVAILILIATLTILSNRIQADTGTCGGVTITLPFNDVMASPFFCQIASAYYSGLTNGTTATTYSPTQTVNREQMAAFISRTLDQSLKRGSERAVAKKWWTPQNGNLTLTDAIQNPQQVEFDGTDLWLTSSTPATVKRVRPSDGKVLGTWTGATEAYGIVCAMGRIFVTGRTNPGSLYMIDPTQSPGPVTVLTNSLGVFPSRMAFDGSRLWAITQNSVSIISLNPTTVTTLTQGFFGPVDILYDGSNVWVTDVADTLLKLDSNGNVIQTIAVGDEPTSQIFDGSNIWVLNQNAHSITVVRVKDASGNSLATPFVLATLTGNGLNTPSGAAFDGERILVTNFNGNSVSLWKATDLTPLGSFPTGTNSAPFGTCSDGLNFWITLFGPDSLARF